jgi:hypothetical protein
MYEDRFCLLPELYDIFGEEALVKFLDVFAGRSVQVPSRDTITRRLRDVRIWLAISEDDSPERVQLLASEYGLDPGYIRDRYSAVSKRMKEFHIKAATNGGEDSG